MEDPKSSREMAQWYAKELEALQLWWDVRCKRKDLRRRYIRGILMYLSICLLIFLLFVFAGRTNVLEMTGRQSPFFSESRLQSMNNISRILSYFPHESGSHNHDSSVPHYKHLPEQDITDSTHKVIFIILDGLRYDYMEKNPDLKRLLTSSAFQNDSRIFKMHAALPTISVPNWATLISGVPPELTGFLANEERKETHFDSILRSAQKFGVSRGYVGTSWISHMYRSDLEVMRGDGGITNKAVKRRELYHIDELAEEVLLYTLDAQSKDHQHFRLLLAHFMAIDDQGHWSGVTKEYNHQDTYNGAITNVTRVLKRIVDLIDNQTTLIITSDHGHIDRGGHGGTDTVLKEVPLIFYQKDSKLGYRADNNMHFKESEYEVESPYQDDDSVERDYSSAKTVKEKLRIKINMREAADSSSNNADTTQNEIFIEPNVNVAPTICALLRIPVPRQAVGIYVEDLINELMPQRAIQESWRDLFIQKKYFVYSFLEELGSDYLEDMRDKFEYGSMTSMDDEQEFMVIDDCREELSYDTRPTSNSRIVCYKDKIDELLEIYYQERNTAFNDRVLRNILLNVLLGVIIFAILLVIAQLFSFCDPLSMVVYLFLAFYGLCKSMRDILTCRKRHEPVNARYFSMDSLSLMTNPKMSMSTEDLDLAPTMNTTDTLEIDDNQPASDSDIRPSPSNSMYCRGRLNIRAFLWSFFIVAVQFPVIIPLLWFACRLRGNNWDFSLWNTTADAYIFLAGVPVVSGILCFVSLRVFSYYSSYRIMKGVLAASRLNEHDDPHLENFSFWKHFLSFFGVFCCNSENNRILSLPRIQSKKLIHSYLFSHYFMMMVVVLVIVTKAIQGCYGIIFVPFLFKVDFMNEDTWDLRFKMMTVELITLPLMFFGTLQMLLCLICPRPSTFSSLFDKLYMLKPPESSLIATIMNLHRGNPNNSLSGFWESDRSYNDGLEDEEPLTNSARGLNGDPTKGHSSRKNPSADSFKEFEMVRMPASSSSSTSDDELNHEMDELSRGIGKSLMSSSLSYDIENNFDPYSEIPSTSHEEEEEYRREYYENDTDTDSESESASLHRRRHNNNNKTGTSSLGTLPSGSSSSSDMAVLFTQARRFDGLSSPLHLFKSHSVFTSENANTS